MPAKTIWFVSPGATVAKREKKKFKEQQGKRKAG